MGWLKWGRPSPAMVVAAISLFVAIGGVAGALPGRNTVDSGDIKKNAVKSADIAANAVRSADIGENQVTGNDISEATLAKVPSAASADSATTAANATNATTASNANNLGGQPASAYATKAGDEAFRTVGGSGVPFNTGWQNVGFGFQAVGYFKDQFGVVHLRGAAERVSGSSNHLFTLPVGYRPTAIENFLVYGDSGVVASVVIQPGGEIFMISGPTAFVSLAGVTFKAL